MRQSERKKYLNDLQEQDELQDNPYPKRKNQQKNVPSFQKDRKYYNKYDAKSTKQYFDILAPPQLPNKSQRQDYNSKNPPKAKEKQPYRNNNYSNYPRQNHNNRDNPRQFVNRPNQQMQRYFQNGNNNRKIQNKSSAPNRKLIDIDENDEDLSYVVDNPFKKDKLHQKNKHEDSFHREEKVQNKPIDDSDWLEEEKEEKAEKKVQIQRGRKRQQRRPQVIKQSTQIKQKSEFNSLNRGFNNLTEQSINSSSIWVDQKILQNLNLSYNQQINDSNISNNHNQSYVSSIRQQSYLNDTNPLNCPQNQRDENEIKKEKLNILDEIQKSKGMPMINVEVSITNVKNIMSAVIKEIQLTQLGMNVELTIRQEGIIVKNKQIEFEKLVQYITFYQINVVYPKVYSPGPITHCFKFCNIRANFQEQSEEIKNTSKFIKKEKKKQKPSLDCTNLMKIVLIQLRCMHCQTTSQLPINGLAITNEAGLSCRECNEQMIAKITVSHSQ